MDRRWGRYLELLENSEPIEEGNHPCLRNGSNFLKTYSEEQEGFPNWFFTTYKFISDRKLPMEFGDRKKSSNEFELLERQEEIGVKAPSPVFQENNFIESEYIPGESLDREIEDNSSDLKEIFREIGRMVDNLHTAGYARWDNRTCNFIVDRSEWSDSPQPFFIDNEYLIPEATEADKELDLVSFIDDINSEEPEKFEEMYSGFRESYGNIDSKSIALAGLRTFLEETLEKNPEKIQYAIKNTMTAFRAGRNSYFDQSKNHLKSSHTGTQG